MSIHKSLRVRRGALAERSVLTRRERVDRLLSEGKFEPGASPIGLPKVRTRFKVLTRKQLKALAAAEAAAAAAAAAGDEADESGEAADASSPEAEG